MFAVSNRNAFSIGLVTLLCLLDVNVSNAETPKYNLIHCQRDLWCFQDEIEFAGTLRKACEGIDPIMPNYRERGILQNNNYARLFVQEWQAEYGKYMEPSCSSIVPTQPLWESRGATEEAHFLSVSTRDCSESPYSHNTCADKCYEDEEESREVYKPIEGCNARPRKSMFEWNALKDGSFVQKTGTRQIQFKAEARCGANWVCTDGGHCGAAFESSRFLTGVGRALETPTSTGISTYFKGTRTYKFRGGDLGSTSMENRMNFWRYYGDQSMLHRIPSGSHYDKCILMNNCNSVGTFKTLYFQFTYAHYNTTWQEGTARVILNGNSITMATKVKNEGGPQDPTWALMQEQNLPIFEDITATWAIFETVAPIDYPTSCQPYYFEIEDEYGITVRLPEDPNLQFATTGNGCDLNHYTTDADGTWDNCRGELYPSPTPLLTTAAATNTPLTTVYVGNNGSPNEAFPLGECEGDCDNDGECAGSFVCFQRNSGDRTNVPGCDNGGPPTGGSDYCYDPAKAPIVVSTAAPTHTPAPLPTPLPTTSAPISDTSVVRCENIIYDVPEFTHDDGTWENFRVQQFGTHSIMGRYGKGQSNKEKDANGKTIVQMPSKEFTVDKDADSVEIRFDFYEIDEWENSDEALVLINNERKVPMGSFTAHQNRYDFLGDSTDALGPILLTRQAKGDPEHIGGHKKKKDQIHEVVITIPKKHYQNSGQIKFKLDLTFDQYARNESGGMDNFKVVERNEEPCSYETINV